MSESFDLTERQAQCASLLALGRGPGEIAQQLGVSPSTVEKHLTVLRRKFDVTSTAELVTRLVGETSPDDVASFHCWPVLTEGGDANGALARLSKSLQSATSMAGGLETLRAALAQFGVQHIYYCLVPLSVQGFLRGDFVDCFLAPDDVQTTFKASGGLMAQPLAMQLFDAPDSVAFGAIGPDPAPTATLQPFYDALNAHGCDALIGLGFPSGGGFVGLAMTLSGGETLHREIDAAGDFIRKAAMVLHSVTMTNGIAAALIGLSIREREALSALAMGKKRAAIAQQMKISDRALGKLFSSARKKFNAGTNAEAVYKASAVNALVFL